MLVDGNYTIKAKVIDGAGSASLIGTDSFIFDATAPTIPTSLTKTTSATDNPPAFAWDAATDATSGIAGYEVRLDSKQGNRWQDGQWTSVGNRTTHASGRILGSGSYTFNVRAVDHAGNASDSISLSFTSSGGGGCGASAVAASAEDIGWSFGLLGFLSASGLYVGQRQKKRKSK